jgi:hypothetical protein
MPALNNRGIITIRDVTRTAVALERLGKHAFAKTNSRNKRRAMFSLRSVPRGYKKDKADSLSQLDFETPACQNMSLGAEELNWGTEGFSRDGSSRSSKRDGKKKKKEFGCAMKTSCVLQLQWGWYNYCVEIRCQDTTSECLTVNCKVCRSAIAL